MIDTKFVLVIEDVFSVLYWPEQSSQFFMIAKLNNVNKLIYPLHSFSLLIRLVEYTMRLIWLSESSVGAARKVSHNRL